MTARWLNGFELRELLTGWAELATSLPVSLITMIDSNPNPAALSVESVIRADPESSTLGSAVILSTPTATNLARDGFFTGFDELWLARSVPTQMVEPPVRITSERPIEALGAAKVAELVAWMRAHGCVLGLGDGDGLNVVALGHDELAAVENVLRQTRDR